MLIGVAEGTSSSAMILLILAGFLGTVFLVLLALLLFSLVTTSSSGSSSGGGLVTKLTRRGRIANRKQYSRTRVLSELSQNVRYGGPPDTVPVQLTEVQPPERRHSLIAAVSLCKRPRVNSFDDSSAATASSYMIGRQSLPKRRASYGSIELMRSSVSSMMSHPRSSVTSLMCHPPQTRSSGGSTTDSATAAGLGRICEETTTANNTNNSNESDDNQATMTPITPLNYGGGGSSSRQRRSSSSSVFDSVSGCSSSTEFDFDLTGSSNDEFRSTSKNRSVSIAVANQNELFGNTSLNVGLGRIFFSVSYNSGLGKLYVTLTKATNIRSSLIRDMSCVYVKITILPSELGYPVFRTNYVTSMGSPMFNQTFSFDLSNYNTQHGNTPTATASSPSSISTELLDDTTSNQENSNQSSPVVTNQRHHHLQLQFTIKEARKFDSNRLIGYVWYDLETIFQEATAAAAIVMTMDNEGGDESASSMTNVIQHEVSRDIFGENRSYQRRGDVLVSIKITLANMPASSSSVNNQSNTAAALANVEICVSEARNLQIKHSNDSIYVRASLMVRNKVIQTRKSQSEKVRHVTSPNFNDKFRFVIPNIQESGAPPISLERDVFVLLCLCSRSRLRVSSRLLGRCILGGTGLPGNSGSLMTTTMSAQPDGQLLWGEALSRPGERVSQWLSLD